mgnify:CR=1 FL=1
MNTIADTTSAYLANGPHCQADSLRFIGPHLTREPAIPARACTHSQLSGQAIMHRVFNIVSGSSCFLREPLPLRGGRVREGVRGFHDTGSMPKCRRRLPFPSSTHVIEIMSRDAAGP